jgi:hypothetical protein
MCHAFPVNPMTFNAGAVPREDFLDRLRIDARKYQVKASPSK